MPICMAVGVLSHSCWFAYSIPQKVKCVLFFNKQISFTRCTVKHQMVSNPSTHLCLISSFQIKSLFFILQLYTSLTSRTGYPTV